MTTITEDYVSFETAKLLKEKGFPQQRMEFVVATRDCSFIVNGSQKVKECAGTKFPYYPYSKLFLYEEDWAVLPTLQMAMRWLRMEHNILLFLLPAQENGKLVYLVEVWTWNEEEGIYESTYAPMPRKEPEEALEASIKYCLEHLI